MRTVFADTFYYLARLSRNDVDRERVLALSQGISANVVTTPWVLTEVADAMSALQHRELFLRLLNILRADGNVTIVPASEDLFDRGLELYSKRTDQDWPLTDCISFATMKEFGLTEALTADHHFEQAGFVALLK